MSENPEKISLEDLLKLVKEEQEKAMKALGQINILIGGKTGVGKSTLINSIFQGNLAETGQGKPVTKNVREYKKEGIPLRIIDTMGLELANFKETFAGLENEIKKRRLSENPNEHIHVGWICISEDSRRVEAGEIELVKNLAQYCPWIGVITKARSDQGFKREVLSLIPEVKNVSRVRAITEILDDGTELKPMGLKELIEATNEVVPEGVRSALAASQKVNIDLKKNRAHKIVMTASSAAGAEGYVPIPFSDAILLVPTQIAMLAGISAVFGLNMDKAFLMTLISSAAGCSAATFTGRALVSNIFKLIPGVGSVIGGTISAATAVALTVGLGEAYIYTLAYLFEKNNGEIPSNEEIISKFKESMLMRKAS